jgi:gliding motility-associated-like protein
LLTIGFLLFYGFSYSQISLQNGSFESSIIPFSTPPSWQNWFGTPDTQPGAFCVSLIPFDGSSYLGLAYPETVGQLLPLPIVKNQLYSFSVALSLSNSTVPFCGALPYPPYPGAFQIWGAKTVFGRSELLWQSDTVDHVGWVEYQGSFKADSNYAYIRLECLSMTSTPQTIYLLVDKLSNFYEINPKVWYTSTETNFGCSSILMGKTDSIAIAVKLKSRYLDTLSATLNAVDTSWNANLDYSAIKNCEIRKDTVIALGYFANGYVAKDTLIVAVDCQRDSCGYPPVGGELVIPNLVTPNGDDKNECFEILNLPNKHQLEIYNRWGQRVYQSTMYENNWQGDDGVYYYLLILEDRSYKGWVQVVR